MKSGKLPVLFLFILLAANVFAGIVPLDNAMKVAKNFVYEQAVSDGQSISIDDIDLQLAAVREMNGQPVFYAWNVSSGGFVIVSADDIYTPVIGYNTVGRFPEKGKNITFDSFIQTYADQIAFGRENQVTATSEVEQSWDYYSTMTTPRLSIEGDRDVEPLLSIMWNQDYPYNAYCPEDEDGPGGHVYAGCVATAMSMIMTYYRYPLHGTGSHSYYASGYGTQTANFGQTYYNWDAMLNSITAGNGMAVNAVAELQYHCGVAVEMGYAPDGSGAYSTDVPPAIKNYFGYSTTAQYIMKMSYTTTTWETMIMQSIDEKEPLYYSGQGSDGGHAFVLDGYQVTGTGKMFHFNFGWSGSENGYYSITDVNGFSSQQGMVRNFIPNPANYPYGHGTHTITSPMGIFEDGSGPLAQYTASGTSTWLIAPTDSVTSITLNFNTFSLGTGDVVNVYNGEDNSAPLMASFTSTSGTSAVTITADRMFIEFISDGTGQGDGFQAEFNSTFPVYCSSGVTTLTDPVGTISDGSGAHNYNNTTVCKWKINPGESAQDLTLSFTSFDLEDGKDFLKVYAIPTNQLLGNFTGTTIPDPIVSPTGQFYILFSSNGFNNAQGFEAEYFISNVGTSEQDFVRNLAIYPNPAKGYTEVKFNLETAAKVNFSLYNLLGGKVYNESVESAAGLVSKTLQLGDLAKGVYMLRISSNQGSVTRKLIVD